MSRENFLLKLTTVEGDTTHVNISNIAHIVSHKPTDKKPAHSTIHSTGGTKVDVLNTTEDIVRKCAQYSSLLKEVL